MSFIYCHNPSLGLATEARGLARVRAKKKEVRELKQEEARELKQEEARELRQEEARESRQKEARESHHILSGVQESVRKCEGVSLHTPKATLT